MSETIVYLSSDTIGCGDEELGAVLMRAFLKNLLALEAPPARILFLHRAVRLTTQGSPVLETMQALEARGVRVLSCGTCLDYFGLKEALVVGQPTTMADTVQALMGAHHVIKP